MHLSHQARITLTTVPLIGEKLYCIGRFTCCRGTTIYVDLHTTISAGDETQVRAAFWASASGGSAVEDLKIPSVGVKTLRILGSGISE